MSGKKEPSVVPYVSEGDLVKAGARILNKDQMNLILKKTPEAHIYERPAKGGGTWRYVTGIHMKKMLNLAFGWNWDFEINEYKFELAVKQAFVLGKLTIRVGEHTITKMQFGRSEIKFKTVWDDKLKKKVPTDEPLDIGNDLKAAATDALKKCASELGFASDIYGSNEFREIKIVGEETEDQLAAIKEILDMDGLRITEDERMQIERIIDEEEVESYNKTLKLLNKRLPKNESTG